MDLEEFERQVLAGEITDFEPYFTNTLREYRYVLAKYGYAVNRVIEIDGDIVIRKFIEDGVHIDRYDEWKDHPNKYIRRVLAKAGYFPDYFINDKATTVREAVIENDMRQGLKRLHNAEDRKTIRSVLEDSSNPNINVLSAYIDAAAKYRSKIHDYPNPALKLKLEGMRYIPTIIEKTMSEEQLFEIGCPLWTKAYTPNQIFYVITAQKNLIKKGFTDFNKVLFDVFKEKERVFHPESIETLTIQKLKERN